MRRPRYLVHFTRPEHRDAITARGLEQKRAGSESGWPMIAPAVYLARDYESAPLPISLPPPDRGLVAVIVDLSRLDARRLRVDDSLIWEILQEDRFSCESEVPDAIPVNKAELVAALDAAVTEAEVAAICAPLTWWYLGARDGGSIAYCGDIPTDAIAAVLPAPEASGWIARATHAEATPSP
ncbi:hypothetical protein J2T57_001215 [Natronocella acetinitrilica]|uniref:Uncharacterized protein n=1 Tax=Natronocella acetinitrilica TaxID=414046 RepID=A0AAE3G4A4_9GAMM|nr:hypothetical protein [Natronocella acetinitrilica]MCP1674113.1 hypothetical protein [Natronocella acetinitrilica]